MKRFNLYYLTNLDRLDKIKELGIKPSPSDLFFEANNEIPCITLFETVHAVEDALFNETIPRSIEDDLVIVAIDAQGLDIAFEYDSVIYFDKSISHDRIIGNFLESDISDYLTLERHGKEIF